MSLRNKLLELPMFAHHGNKYQKTAWGKVRKFPTKNDVRIKGNFECNPLAKLNIFMEMEPGAPHIDWEARKIGEDVR